jgi:hypothetical protein
MLSTSHSQCRCRVDHSRGGSCCGRVWLEVSSLNLSILKTLKSFQYARRSYSSNTFALCCFPRVNGLANLYCSYLDALDTLAYPISNLRVSRNTLSTFVNWCPLRDWFTWATSLSCTLARHSLISCRRDSIILTNLLTVRVPH